MSPELTRMQKYGPKTEVWSLGATLYEMSLGWLRGMPTRHVTENLKDNDPESRMLISFPFANRLCVQKLFLPKLFVRCHLVPNCFPTSQRSVRPFNL